MQLIPAHFARTRCFALAVCLFLLGGFSVGAAVVNDLCSGSMIIPGAGPFPYDTPLLDITDAGTVNDPPFPPASTSFDTNITRSVWYKFTPSASALYTISTGLDTDTTFRDTSMIIYTAASDCANFTIHSFNEDSGTLRSAISTNLVGGTTYYIVVWVGRTEVVATGQRLDLALRVTKPALPSNDTCTTPMAIPSVIATPYVTPVVDTTLATTTPGLSPQCLNTTENPGAAPSREVWYQFTPATGGTYNFSTAADTLTRIDDTIMSLYTLGSGCQFPSQVACSDNRTGRAVISQMLTAGTTYFLAVWDNSASYIPGETDLQLRVSPATRPSVTTLPPTNISSSVTLNGTVNANGLLGRFWFEWGTTISLGSTSQVRVLFATATLFDTNLVVTGFQPNTLYYYKMVATNTLGRTDGALETFFWNNSAPVLSAFDREFGATRFEFVGAPSHLYQVQQSTNLINWTDLGRATESSSASYEYRHSLPTPAPQNLFYRVRQP